MSESWGATVIANYGYEDGSGFYYITIDGDVCALRGARCVAACPQAVYAVEWTITMTSWPW